jgi:5-carboxymethyl-2-hydroxymuconate isomerase
MRLASFTVGGREGYGAVTPRGVVDLGGKLGARWPNLAAALAPEALGEISGLLASASPDHALDDIGWLCPIPAAEKIICIGVNYPERNDEYRDGSARPQFPSVFLRTPDSVVGHGEELRVPRESEQLDYEGEIALVIGKGGRRIPTAEAWAHVAGITCMNEGTVRDWVRHGKFNVTQGKNFVASGAAGPWITTLDELGDRDSLEVATRVNGEARQRGRLGDLLFPVPYLIHYLSSFMRLKPGDLIATGTPPGAGARRDPPVFLRAGDVVEVEVSGVGVLRNEVAPETP